MNLMMWFGRGLSVPQDLYRVLLRKRVEARRRSWRRRREDAAAINIGHAKYSPDHNCREPSFSDLDNYSPNHNC